MEQGALENRIALVAGGADHPGSGIVQVLLEAGATVIVPVPDAAGIQTLRQSIPVDFHDRLITYPTDFGDYEKAEELIDIIVSEYGQINLVVAAIEKMAGHSPLLHSDIKEWNRAVDCNMTPTFIVDRLCLPLLGAHGGVLVNITNADRMAPGGDSPMARLIGYAGIELSKVFAEEVRAHNIHYYHLLINNLAPMDATLLGSGEREITPSIIGNEVLRLYAGAAVSGIATFHFCTGKPLDASLLTRLEA